eukprot:345022_1
MHGLNWKKAIPAIAVILLSITVIYITQKQNQNVPVEEKQKQEHDHEEPDNIDEEKKNEQEQIQDSKSHSQFHINDEIEIQYKNQWRKAVVGDILETLSVSIPGVSGANKFQHIIIDNKKQIFCDCYDICKVKTHRIRRDNKQSQWAKSIQQFLNNKLIANRILFQEVNFYRICCKYWNNIKANKNININRFISYNTYKYNQFMMNISSFIKQKKK